MKVDTTVLGKSEVFLMCLQCFAKMGYICNNVSILFITLEFANLLQKWSC